MRRGLRRRKLRVDITAMTIHKYLRTQLHRAYIDKKAKSCYITGRTDNLECHHNNVSFLRIVNRAHKKLGIENKEYVEHYTLEELVRLKQEVIRMHEDCKMYTLTASIHKDLHYMFGREISDTQLEAYKRMYDSRNSIKEEMVC